jgi:hypothetical protein
MQFKIYPKETLLEFKSRLGNSIIPMMQPQEMELIVKGNILNEKLEKRIEDISTSSKYSNLFKEEPTVIVQRKTLD